MNYQDLPILTDPSPAQQRLANRVARRAHCGRATEIRIDPDPATHIAHVADHTPYGYRKFTTGQYVPNSYRRNFGWKNTYYQGAKTIVIIPLSQLPE